MNNKIIIIIFICIYLFIIYYTYRNENFISDSNNTETNINSYFKPFKNIFLGNNYYNYQLNHPKINIDTQSLNKITFDSLLYSKPTTQKIICSSHTNNASCWEDNVNNCQWIYKIDSGSYCDVASILL